MYTLFRSHHELTFGVSSFIVVWGDLFPPHPSLSLYNWNAQITPTRSVDSVTRQTDLSNSHQETERDMQRRKHKRSVFVYQEIGKFLTSSMWNSIHVVLNFCESETRWFDPSGFDLDGEQWKWRFVRSVSSHLFKGLVHP